MKSPAYQTTEITSTFVSRLVRYSCDEHGADLMNYQIDPATYGMVSEPPCPKCGEPMKTKVLIKKAGE